jgi:hypothetical protein
VSQVTDPKHTNNYGWICPYIKEKLRFAVEIGSRDCLDAIQVANHFEIPLLAFEPDPKCFELCKENIHSFNENRVEVKKIALSDYSSTSNIYIAKEIVVF